MIKYILGWLWDFNHIHKWKFLQSILSSVWIGAAEIKSQKDYFVCETCGKMYESK